MSFSKGALLFLTFYSYFHQSVASSWTVDIPASVKALEGSCVVIPCSFDYPHPDKEVTHLTGIWTDEGAHVIFHPDERKALVQYRNRTDLLGDLHRKDCSLKIDPVQASDKGPYHFRIEIAKFDNYSYREKTVSIITTTDLEPVELVVKEEVLLDDSVSAQCSVSHSCPHSPPHFSWTHSGHEQLQHQKIGEALWRTNSTITFVPSHADNNKKLQCTVTHKGGRQQRASTILSVQYAPEIRNTSSCHHEGRHVQCLCLAESNPPSDVRLLLSDGALPNSRTDRYGLLTVVTAQTDAGFFSSVRCTANNTVGKAELVLALPLSNTSIYIWAGSGAAALIAIILLIVVVAKKCSGRGRENTSTNKPNHDVGLETPQYVSAPKRQSDGVPQPVSLYSDHIYGNTENYDADDETVYANV